jgi:hypothetical protein
MDLSKGPKRLLEYESKNETDRDEAKGQHTVLNYLKAKVRTTTTKERTKLRPPSFHLYLDMPEETFMKEDLDVKVIKTKSLWMPSFIWEDFVYLQLMIPHI